MWTYEDVHAWQREDEETARDGTQEPDISKKSGQEKLGKEPQKLQANEERTRIQQQTTGIER